MSSNKLFDSATVRLTGWYLLILVVLSLFFSVIVYTLASHEFERAAGPRRVDMVIIDEIGDFNERRQQRIEISNRYLITNLVMFNIFTITAGGIASYLLARRTLRPIRDAMESQAQFSSDAAHELRTPLAVMRSEIEVELRDKQSSKASRGKILLSTLDEVNRLQTLTERLLMLANKSRREISPIWVEASAIDAVNQSIAAAQAKHIVIDHTVGREKAMADQAGLTDVLSILLDNAIKYSPPKSNITVSSRHKDSHIDIDVQDNGIGISSEHIPKIFDRFYRADTSRTKANVEGHGLGLSIAKRIAEAMGGELRVRSTLGEGGTFTVRLPRAKK